MKGSFLLKISQREVFNELSNEEAGKLIKGIFNYVCDGESGLNGVLNAVFIPIKADIDKNEEKYKAICERNKKNGLNGGRPKNSEETQENPMGNNELEIEENKTQNNPVGNFGENTHISYITNHNSNNHNNHNSNIIKEIIDYLNFKTNSHFKYSSEKTKSLIKTRINDGFLIEDFKTVIDNKTTEWVGTDFEKFLRPETLFSNKFEGYLNQKTTQRRKTLKDISMSDLDRAIELEKERNGV